MRKASKPKTKKDWGDGKQHSVSLKTHQKNVKTKRAARANDPAKFVAPRGATDVNRDATTSANLRYGEVERAQAQQGQQIPAWFQSYRDQVSGINTGIQAGYQKAIGEVNARQQATAASDTTARTALGSQMQTDAASRGATVDPSLLAGDANAANVRNTNQAAFANLLGAQGQANADYYGGQQQAGSAAELQQKMRLAGDVKGTAADKGAYRATYVTDARDKERTNLLQRAAFEMPTANAALTAQTQTANSKRTARSQAKARKVAKTQKDQDQALARSKLKTEQEKIAYDRAHPKAKAKKPLSAAGLKTKSMIRTGVHRVRAQDVNRAGYWEKSFNTLVETDGLDPVVARAIIQGARHGKLGPKTAKTLKDDFGIEGLKFPKPPKRKGSNSGSGGGPHGTNRP